jgi:hypothetical protein
MLTLLDESPGGKRGNRRCTRDRPQSSTSKLVGTKMGRLIQRRGDDDLYDEMLPEQHSLRGKPVRLGYSYLQIFRCYYYSCRE